MIKCHSYKQKAPKQPQKGVGGRHKLPGQTMRKLNVNAKLLCIKSVKKINEVTKKCTGEWLQLIICTK